MARRIGLRVLMGGATLFLLAFGTAERSSAQMTEIIESLDLDPEDAAQIAGLMFTAFAAMNEVVEDLTADYDAEMVCPGGEPLVRERSWDGTQLRALPIRGIAEDIQAQCTSPAALVEEDLQWWLSPAEQRYACSGPFGRVMSRWGEEYEFLQEACVIHDICYRSDSDKDSCDAGLIENMRTLCRNPGVGDWLTSPLCEAAVEITERAVGQFAFDRAYESGQSLLAERGGADA